MKSPHAERHNPAPASSKTKIVSSDQKHLTCGSGSNTYPGLGAIVSKTLSRYIGVGRDAGISHSQVIMAHRRRNGNNSYYVLFVAVH